jgi:hypothetical protein
MKRALLIIADVLLFAALAVCIVATIFAESGCASRKPPPGPADRYTVQLLDASGNTLATAKFGEMARGGRIVVEDSQTDLRRSLGCNVILDYINGEATHFKPR